ncbi:hypothetical protein [Sediminibacterium soli]|uniref:hypothetical protein n=1 Tax=Sediminibacterium soli TaxID=2698829 RepID=UPI001379A322|nr:hypothetical protein [Sediminibacterium soli]NCI48264.1 hypothetical protein [Sediminibacterium soli]
MKPFAGRGLDLADQRMLGMRRNTVAFFRQLPGNIQFAAAMYRSANLKIILYLKTQEADIHHQHEQATGTFICIDPETQTAKLF